MGEGSYFTHSVVHDPDLDSFPDLVCEDLQDSSPHIAFVDYEILHEDEFLGLLQFFKKCLEFIFTERKVGDVGIAEQRIAARSAQVQAQVISAGTLYIRVGEGFF